MIAPAKGEHISRAEPSLKFIGLNRCKNLKRAASAVTTRIGEGYGISRRIL